MSLMERWVRSAMDGTTGQARERATEVMEDVERMVREHAEGVIRGVRDSYGADPSLTGACETLLGTVGIDPGYASGYASDMIRHRVYLETRQSRWKNDEDD